MTTVDPELYCNQEVIVVTLRTNIGFVHKLNQTVTIMVSDQTTVLFLRLQCRPVDKASDQKNLICDVLEDK